MANHDKTFTAGFPDRPATESGGKSDALGCLNAAIDAFSEHMPRKGLAGECGKSEATFSKMTGGTQAFGIDDFGRLPRRLQVEFMKRYGREVLGLQVLDLDPAELNQELLDAVDRVVALRRMAGVRGKTSTAKADLRNEDRAAANW